ncbi:MAG: hypothetical protein IH618_04995 [Ignavibacteriaceae bacterium]|nr:hypothetical protein [Ignavibacteriaceae bacterium]
MNKCNKKYFRTFLLFLFTFLIFNLSAVGGFFSAEATVRYVSKTGQSIPPYTSWKTGSDSIQKCIDISFFGDTIYVANGVYEEQVIMIPGLSLIGQGTDSCWIDSRQLVTMQNAKTVDMKNNCLVKGFYILSSISFDYGYGIFATGQTGIITLNKFSNANVGIVLDGSSISIYKNFCINLRQGVNVFNSNSIVRKNEIYTLTDQIGTGIFISGFSDNYYPLIDSNYIATRTDGIRKSLGTRPIINNNVIEFMQYGGNGIDVSFSDSTFVYNNLILMGTGIRGIYNYNVPYLQVMNNYIQGRSIM